MATIKNKELVLITEPEKASKAVDSEFEGSADHEESEADVDGN